LDLNFSSGTVDNGVFKNIGSQGDGDGIDVNRLEMILTFSKLTKIPKKLFR
jgi:hypothetical protein